MKNLRRVREPWFPGGSFFHVYNNINYYFHKIANKMGNTVEKASLSSYTPPPQMHIPTPPRVDPLQEDIIKPNPSKTRLKEIYRQNYKLMTRISDLSFGYPRSKKHVILMNSSFIEKMSHELNQYNTLDLFELLNLSTGLGYPMASIRFAYNDKFTVKDYFLNLAYLQDFPKCCISASYGNRSTVNISYHDQDINEEFACGCKETVMNIEIQYIQLEVLNLLELYTRLPSDIVIIIYECLIGCIAQIYQPFSIRDLGIDYNTYSSDDNFRRFLRKNGSDLSYIETIDFTNRSISEIW